MNPPSYTASSIGRIVNGELITGATDDPPVSDLLIDSRRLVHGEGTLFIALVSSRNDGHLYIEELSGKGVKCFLVNRSFQNDLHRFPRDRYFILVDDTLAALQRLAAFHRSCFRLPVIGITGSNGKTIVKEWLYQLLSHDMHLVRSPKSYNSQVGVPLSVWRMNNQHELAVFEAGISEPGEMERLERIIRPEIGIFTNLGSAHDQSFASAAEKLREKMNLFAHSRILIYCADQPYMEEYLTSGALPGHLKTYNWSLNREADLMVTRMERRNGTTMLTARTAGKEFSFSIPFSDDASLENALHCVTAILALSKDDWASGKQVRLPDIISRTSGLTPVAMRLELKEAINHCSLINDSYNSDFQSLVIALDFMNQQRRHEKMTVILSDMLQTGVQGDKLYHDIARLLVSKGSGRLIGIGPGISKRAGLFDMEKQFFPDTESFLRQFPFSSFHNEIILLKGARIFEFERISQLLMHKVHETVLEINLDALVHNLNHYRSLLSPATRIMAMVKAFSYGSGSDEIAHVLNYHHIDYLAVAYADEGVELRKAGIRAPIMVMSPEPQGLETILKYNLEPEIYGFRILDLLEDAIEKNQTSNQDMVKIHIKLDTGMHRLGFIRQEIGLLTRRLKRNPGLYVQSVFSHLAASEDPAEDDFTRSQISLFQKMSDDILAVVDHPVMRHIVNTAGISRFPEARFDMVRLGIGLYGVGHSEEECSLLRNVGTLKTVITQIKEVPRGGTIGYNRNARADRPVMIAIIPVGYADGLDRRLGNGNGIVFVRGQAVPTIGNICMDLTILDITRLIHEGYEVLEGDEVIVFGDIQPVTELAKRTGTIPYEILTSISGRVRRVYFYE